MENNDDTDNFDPLLMLEAIFSNTDSFAQDLTSVTHDDNMSIGSTACSLSTTATCTTDQWLNSICTIGNVNADDDPASSNGVIHKVNSSTQAAAAKNHPYVGATATSAVVVVAKNNNNNKLSQSSSLTRNLHPNGLPKPSVSSSPDVASTSVSSSLCSTTSNAADPPLPTLSLNGVGRKNHKQPSSVTTATTTMMLSNASESPTSSATSDNNNHNIARKLPPPNGNAASPCPANNNKAEVSMCPIEEQKMTNTNTPPPKKESLVQQFANLAKKLGVELTPSVLDSLRDNHNNNRSNGSSNAKPEKEEGGAPAAKKIKLALSTDDNDTIAFVPKAQAIQEVAQETVAAISSRNAAVGVGSYSLSSSISSVTNMNSVSPPESVSRPGKKRKRVLTPAELNEKVAALHVENEKLRKQVDIVTNKTIQFDKDRELAERRMRAMIQDKNVSSVTLDEVVANHLEMYADYGNARHEELTFHLEQLEKLAAPTTVTKMSLWTLGQNDEFYRNYKRPHSLAGILMRELDISPQQGKQIMVHRKTIRRLADNMQASRVLLKKLQYLCLHKQQVFRDRMVKCQEILTPLQVVKLLLWVDNNQSTLSHVCPGWVSERINVKNGNGSKGDSGGQASATAADVKKKISDANNNKDGAEK